MPEYVVLVDAQDREVGVAEKMQAHREGVLHRAFSIFVLNFQGEILLQQRSWSKYHSGGLWTNTCCSHPRPQETLLEAAHRRLQEEMGFDCPLQEVFSFLYRAQLDHDLIEHELDHVLVGQFAGEPVINPEEVAAWKWIDRQALQWELENHSDRYTYWLRVCFPQLLTHLPTP